MIAALSRRWPVRVAGVAGVTAAFVLAKGASGLMTPFVFGLVIAAALPVLALLPSPEGLYRRVARASSEISYTLYLSHFPVLLLVTLTVLGPDRFAPGFAGAAVYIGLLLAVLAWAAALWWCFERNTDRVHARLRNALGPRVRHETAV